MKIWGSQRALPNTLRPVDGFNGARFEKVTYEHGNNCVIPHGLHAAATQDGELQGGGYPERDFVQVRRMTTSGDRFWLPGGYTAIRE